MKEIYEFFHMIEVLNSLVLFIEAHRSSAYFILFFGAIVETIFPVSFFVYGEVFFLAGSMLAGIGLLSIYVVAPLLIFGSILGDNASFALGKFFGKNILKSIREHPFLGKLLHEKSYNHLKDFFKTQGGRAVFLARFGGPLSRVTPFLAGTFKVPYREFVEYNTPGVIGGVGIFIIVGFFFGQNIETILSVINDYVIFFFLLLLVIVTCYYFFRKYTKKKKKLLSLD